MPSMIFRSRCPNPPKMTKGLTLSQARGASRGDLAESAEAHHARMQRPTRVHRPSTSCTRCLGGVDPADADDLGTAVGPDDGPELPDPKGVPGKVGRDQIKELLDVGCPPVHDRHVVNRPSPDHALVEQLH